MTLDELLVEWSYRTKKGYPDMGNPSDILILKEILEIDGRNCFVVEFENNINQLITLCQNEKHEWEILEPN